MTDTPPPGAAAPSGPDDFTALDGLADQRYVTVRAGGQELTVTVDSPDPAGEPGAAAVTALLPRVRSLLTGFAVLRERAVEHLWEWGAEGTETAGERAEFLRDAVPSTLVVTAAGTAQLHFEGLAADRTLDGYWPAVHHDAEGRPVRVTVEA
ncbi:hypothetical protein JNUCC64_04335 [Streptomyces sp. JNUCC 64]